MQISARKQNLVFGLIVSLYIALIVFYQLITMVKYKLPGNRFGYHTFQNVAVGETSIF